MKKTCSQVIGTQIGFSSQEGSKYYLVSLSCAPWEQPVTVTEAVMEISARGDVVVGEANKLLAKEKAR